MTTRHDMFVELATDQVNQVQQLLDEGRYREVHDWLWPIFYKNLKQELAEMSDDDLESHYADQMGVDIPSSPSLSSTDEEEEVDIEAYFGKSPSQETANRGSLPEPSGMERSKVSDVHSICDEKGMAEMAATLRGIVSREETVHGLQPTTEVRIPVRLLLRLVHGEGCLG